MQIINFNLDLVSLGQMNEDINAAARSGKVVGPVGGIDLGRSLRLWLNLQNSLNALFDSTTAEGAAAGGQVITHKALGDFEPCLDTLQVIFWTSS